MNWIPADFGRPTVRKIERLIAQLRAAAFRRRLRRSRVGLRGQIYLSGAIPPLFRNQGRIELGDATQWGGTSFRTEVSVAAGGELRIGSGTFVNQGVTIHAEKQVVLGPGCLLGEHVAIHDTCFHSIRPIEDVRTAPTILGRNVWLGHRVVVLPGVTIGDHSVVGAGSVVTTSLPDRCVAVGTPARVISTFDCPDDWKR